MKTSLQFAWTLLVLAFLASCGNSTVAGGDHGTDRPNALTIQVKNANGQALRLATVMAVAKFNSKDTLYQCTTDTLGFCKINLSDKDSLIRVVASYNDSSSQSIFYQEIPAPQTDTSVVSLNAFRSSTKQIEVTGTNDLDFQLYFELRARPATDLLSGQWDSLLIQKIMDTAAKRHATGLSYPLYYSGSFITDSVPKLSPIAQKRIFWLMRELNKRKLYLHLIAFSDADSKLSQAPWFKYMTDDLWLSNNYYYNTIVPFIESLCQDSICYKDFDVEVSDHAEIFPRDSLYSNITHTANLWRVSATHHNSGFGLLDYSLDLNSSSLLRTNLPSIQFITTRLDSPHSPLSYPSLALNARIPILVRWVNSAEPGPGVLQTLRNHHYAGIIIPEPYQ